jgi:hypothetical protein
LNSNSILLQKNFKTYSLFSLVAQLFLAQNLFSFPATPSPPRPTHPVFYSPSVPPPQLVHFLRGIEPAAAASPTGHHRAPLVAPPLPILKRSFDSLITKTFLI